MDDFFEAIFEGLFESIGDILEGLIEGLLEGIGELFEGLFEGFFEGIGEFLEGLFEGLFEGIGDFFEGFFEVAGDFFEGFFEGTGDFFEVIFEFVGDFFRDIFANLFEGSDGSLESSTIDVSEISENVFGSFIERVGDSLQNIFKHSSSDSFADLIGVFVDDGSKSYAKEKKEDYPVIKEDYLVTSEYNNAFPIAEKNYEVISPTTDNREEFSDTKLFFLLFVLLICIIASFFWILVGSN